MMIDEVAFVESLFSPELRSTPLSSPKPLLSLSQLNTPRPLAIKPTAATSDEPEAMADTDDSLMVRLSVGDDDTDMFNELLDEHETDEEDTAMLNSLSVYPATRPSTKTLSWQDQHGRNAYHDSPRAASLLMDPLEYTKGGLAVNQSLVKDTFQHLTESPIMTPMGSTKLLHEWLGTVDPHRTPRNSDNDDDFSMPILPLGSSSSGLLLNHDNQAVLALQSALWSNGHSSTSSSNSMQTAKTLVPTQTSPMAHEPIIKDELVTNDEPSSTVGLPDEQMSLWISTSLLTPTGPAVAPDLARKISNKRSKARQAADASNRSQKASAASAALAQSLASANKAVAVPTTSAPSSGAATATTTTKAPAERVFKGKKCIEPNCTRRAQSNSRCKAHGGGARCQFRGGCTRSSQGGGFCRAHGGGKRCEFPGCTRGQQRKGRCYVHGGIRKCQMVNCEKKDRGNGFCISHGGGKRCEHPGCGRAVRRGNLCQLHE